MQFYKKYNVFLVAIILFIGSKMDAQLSISPIDTDGEVLAIYYAENGLIYYVQEGDDPIYRKKNKLGWLKVYDGYNSRRLHSFRLKSKKTDVVKLNRIGDHKIHISTAYDLYVYDIKKNAINRLPTGIKYSMMRSNMDVQIFSIEDTSSTTVCYKKIEGDQVKDLMCVENGATKFHLLKDRLLTYRFDYSNKSSTFLGKYSHWLIYDFEGNKIREYDKKEVSKMFPSQDIASIYSIYDYTENDNLFLKLILNGWIQWDPNSGFREIPDPKGIIIDEERRYVKQEYNGEETTLTIYDSKDSLLRTDTGLKVGRVNSVITTNGLKSYWVGSQKGLFELKSDVGSIRKVLPKRSIRSIYPYNNEYLLVGTESFSFFKIPRQMNLNDEGIIQTNQRSFLNTFIDEINEELFVSSHNTLRHFESGKKVIERGNHLTPTIVSKIGPSKAMVSCDTEMIYIFDGASGTIDSFKINNTRQSVVAIQSISERHVAIAAINGLYVYDLMESQFIYSESTVEANLSLFKFEDGSFYLGRENGDLIKFIPNEESYKVGKKWSIKKPIASINSIDGKELWLGTFNGISKLDTKSGIISNIENKLITDPECNRFSTFYDAEHELMYIGTIEGLNIIDVNSEIFKDEDFDLIFIDYSTSQGKELQSSVIMSTNDAQITLPAKNRGCNFTFTSNTILNGTSNMTYRYRINDGSWSAFSKNNFLNFSYFKTGNNLLEIEGMSSKGKKSNNILKANIYATPQFYEVWWFRLAFGSMILVGIIYWYRRISRENLRLEKEVALRTAEIEEERITVERQAKDLEQLDSMKNQFFANVSHELRTPLTLLISPLEKLSKEKNLTEKQKALTKLMEDNGRLLQERIDELLELSRLEAHKVKLNSQSFRLDKCIDFSTRIFKTLVKEKDIELQVIQNNTEFNIISDQKRLTKIIQNLIGNAIKFSPKGKTVEAFFKLENESLQFEIKDSGIGISTENQKKIFDRFFQVNSGNTNSNPGTGIGLAMVKEYIELMNGTIKVESKLGEGTTFKGNISIKYASEFDIENEDQEIELQELSFTPISNKLKPKLLIAEDNRGLRLYIKCILEPYFNIIEATNGKEAIDLLHSIRDIDIILSDIMMPEMDGITLLSKIRTNNDLRIKPVIFLTAKHSKADIYSAYRLGVDDYLKKPFSEDELLYRLNAIYQNYKVRVTAQTEQNNSDHIIDEKKDDSFISVLHNIIIDHLDAHDFSVDLIAEKLGVSSRHLIRLVKKEIGMSPKDYIREVKLNRARHLLETGVSDNPKVVANMVGFSTPSYFLKLYEKRFGSSFKR